MKNNKIFHGFIILLIIAFGCTRSATDFKSYLNGKELIYPGVLSEPLTLSGNNRLMLTWHPNPDPSVTKYVVYWNNYADSITVPATSHNPADTVKCLINNLEEYNYTFFINSYDAAGNKSIVTEVDNARVYGKIYQASLQNRPMNIDTPYIVQPDQKSVLLNFLTPDSLNVNTFISYTNTSGTIIRQSLAPNKNEFLLSDYKFGTTVTYQSAFIPSRDAIDSFTTLRPDTVTTIYKYVECDKKLFAALNLPHDIHDTYYGTSFASIWDGSTNVKGYPDAFCSDGIEPLSNHFSIDLGKTYDNIARIQEIGRNCCDNPIDFEIWGIADTTNAVSQLPGNDANWKNDVMSKGWTLLGEINRNDNGSDPVTKDLVNNPPPVRYIMVRVLKTAGGGSGVNLSQVTFWYKQS